METATMTQTNYSPAMTSSYVPSVTDLKSLIESQRRFFATGKTRDLSFRVEALNKLLRILQDREEEIIEALRLDLNKPQLEAYSTEIAYVLEDIKQVIRNVGKWSKPKKIGSPLVLMPAKSRIYSEPYGNTLIIAPWNYPFQLTVSPLIGAIAAGNTAILKPSELTPHTQKLLCKLIGEAFPAEYVTCVGGGVEESQALLNEKFDFIFFTGSTKVGRIVMEKASKYLTPVCLELGGKSPCIVDADIDVKTTARRIVWGKFMNAGQTCVAPDYVLVDRKVQDRLVSELKTTLEEFYGKDAKASDSYARIVNTNHVDRLSKLINQKKVLHGGKVAREEKFIEPTLVAGDWSDEVMEDEIFGPILPIIAYDNLDTALNEVRRRSKPLAFYLFTKNKNLQEKVITNMSFGGACVNDCIVHLANPDLPFGGVGESGIGSYHGQTSFDLFSHKKSVLMKPFWGDATMRYAPYTNLKMKLIRFFMG